MKKKVFALSIVMVLLAIAVVGGSLAWFTDTDEVKNTFTVGSVEIKQIEVFDETKAQLLPVVGIDPTNEKDNYIEKKVTVKNTGKNPAYIQTFVAVPKVLDDCGVLKLYDTTTSWAKYAIGPATIDGEEYTEYTVYRYRYNSELAAGTETADACLKYVYIDCQTNLKTYDTNNNGMTDKAHFVAPDGTEITAFNVMSDKLNIYVASQAVQSEGFASAADALDSAFASHPWVTTAP